MEDTVPGVPGPTGPSSPPVTPGAAAVTALKLSAGRWLVVLGDLMLDEWIMGSASRISPEAPVPVVRLQERRTAPGGAANVAMNLLGLGARVRVCGVIGADAAGYDLEHELRGSGLEISGVVRDAGRPTTLKTRIVAQQQQMVRVDRESDDALTPEMLQQLTDWYAEGFRDAVVLCISDYDKGLAACGAVEAAIGQAHAAGLRVTGGPKPHNLARFSGADFLSLNQKEAAEAAGLRLDSDAAVERAGQRLREQTGAAALVITRGARGATLCTATAAPRHFQAHAVEVFDVAGAGDTFLAAASMVLASGADYALAVEAGNLAAAASVRHAGVVAVTPAELRRVASE